MQTINFCPLPLCKINFNPNFSTPNFISLPNQYISLEPLFWTYFNIRKLLTKLRLRSLVTFHYYKLSNSGYNSLRFLIVISFNLYLPQDINTKNIGYINKTGNDGIFFLALVSEQRHLNQPNFSTKNIPELLKYYISHGTCIKNVLPHSL